jgi:hypothetical protein
MILGGRDRTAVTSVEAQCEKSRDQVDPAEGANTGYLAPPRLTNGKTSSGHHGTQSLGCAGQTVHPSLHSISQTSRKDIQLTPIGESYATNGEGGGSCSGDEPRPSRFCRAGVDLPVDVAAAGQPDDLGMPILEPVSGQVGLRVLGKVISGCRDRTAITSVEAECENPETKSTGREGANTWVFGAAPGNLRRAATDWWSN